MKLFCFMVSGVLLSEIQADALYRAAKRLIKSGKNELKFKHDDIEGVVQTELQHCSLGGTSGIFFQSDFDCEKGSCKATFMVRSNDFDHEEDAKWYMPSDPNLN